MAGISASSLALVAGSNEFQVLTQSPARRAIRLQSVCCSFRNIHQHILKYDSAALIYLKDEYL
jgi:hypothetical protein